MKKSYLPFIVLIMAVAGCKDGESTLSGGIDVANMDMSVNPGTDFYQYACGGWMERHPLTDEYSRFGSFDMLAENNRLQIQQLIEEMAKTEHKAGTVAQKIGDLYAIAMDSVKLNDNGVAPIKGWLDKIAAVGKEEVPQLIAEMYHYGFAPYFHIYVGADAKESDMNIVNSYQGGISLGEKEYYLEDDDHTVDIREKYQLHIATMFRLVGFTAEQAEQAAKSVMQIETELAKSSRSNVELRNPLANYNKMTVEQLQKDMPEISWARFLATGGYDGLKEINVGQPEALKRAVEIIAGTDMEVQRSYLQWQVIDRAASFLSDEIAEQNFAFYGRVLSGAKEMQPRWKRAVSSVNGVLGEAVGQVYVEKHFPPAAKDRMIALVENLRIALGERIKNLTWMSGDTKVKAQEKLDAFSVKIGYPDKWKDYSSLEIKNDSYWENILRASNFSYNEMIAKAGKPVDREEWLMTPQTVNAYYNPTTNEVCFPAGILQYPFFDMNADDAFNYGAIGVVIGHEMTHGFDDQGRQFDKDGNLQDWWSAEDAVNFEERTKVLVDHFNKIEVLPGLNANGELTLGENIADYGGLQISYSAFISAIKDTPLGVKDGFSPEQRFFIAYSNLWAGNIRDEQIRMLTKADVHSLGRWRVNGTLPHIDAWYDAFGIKEGDAIYLPEEARASIW